MAAAAVQGTVLKRAGTVVNYVEGIDGPTASKNTIDVTAINDTAAKFVAGLVDYGTCSFNIFYDPVDAVHILLKTDFDTVNSSTAFTITMSNPANSIVSFTGLVNEFAFSYAKGAANMVKVGVKITGAVTVT